MMKDDVDSNELNNENQESEWKVAPKDMDHPQSKPEETENSSETAGSSTYRYTRGQIYNSSEVNKASDASSGNVYGPTAGMRTNSGYNTYNQASNSSFDTGRNPYYQNYQRSTAAPPPAPKAPKKRKKFGGILKVICYALVFGLVAGALIEGIHFAGSAIRGDNAQETQKRENVVDVVRVSSEDVQTFEAQDVSDIVDAVMPAVVSVNTIVEKTTQDFFGRVYSQEGEGAGSGFIFSQDDGNMYLVTNYHVIEDSKYISVTFNDGSNAEASIKGYVEDEDIAVLVVPFDSLSEETKSAVQVAVIGDSDALKAGNGAIAIGNALGYGQSVTTGAISAVERMVQLTDGEMTLIQTSAAINPGNSGGPLLNTRGEVIGINTVKYSETTVEGMGFAIPMNSAMETITGIISGEIVNKSDSDSVYFGIKGGTVTQDLAEQIGCPQGVYVSYVYSGSAAHRAGLSQGCIITGFDGTPITTIEELQECLTNYAPGDTVTIDICTTDRSGDYTVTQTLTTILGSRAEAPEEY